MKRRTWLRLNGIENSSTFNMDRYMENKRKQAQEAEAPLFKDICPVCGGDSCKCGTGMCDCDEKRMDIIGQNGNDGEHYAQRSNWWGLADSWDTSEDWADNDELSEYEKQHGQDGTAANNMLFENLATTKVKKNYEI